MKKLTFEWDFLKANSNFKKHGISFEEATQVFHDPLALTITDPDHSDNEIREITIGQAFSLKIIVVSHTDRSGRIRIISARKATRNELKNYEE